MADYGKMLAIAKKLGYNGFTELQECAFSSEDAYDTERNLFVIGETSSGKTLIPLLLYAAALEEAKENDEPLPRMLFLVPYRALAAQKVEEIRELFPDEELAVIQSTGEFRQDDEAIQNASVHIAVVISEKIFKYEARNPGFLSKYDFLVIDEIGLISNAERGIRLDFILAWAMNQKLQNEKPRIIALGTPFFDWSMYIRSYDFAEIRTDKRPVPLEEISITYDRYSLKKIEGNAPFLRCAHVINEKQILSLAKKYEVPGSPCDVTGEEIMCGFLEPCRSDDSLNCPHTGKKCKFPVLIYSGPNRSIHKDILYRICKEHLSRDHQILIFINDRARVMDICEFLYKSLEDMLPEAPPAEECRKKLLAECGLEGDDVFGILEYDPENDKHSIFYRAFLSGVGFHSAALPNELRTYVEKKLLSSRDMRIVCSTETLAFGVNSSVDVVIVADLTKQEGAEGRILQLNEFQNYAGRAGRLRTDVDKSEIKGYVYTLLSDNTAPKWAQMLADGATPETLYSLFHADEGQYMPFFLLNILPAEGEKAATISRMLQILHNLPRDGSITDEDLERSVKMALRFLENQKLIAKIKTFSYGRGALAGGGIGYCLTSLGIRLRGYILGRQDYEKLVDAIERSNKSLFLDMDRILFLYCLLQTNHVKKGISELGNKFSDRNIKEYISSYSREVNASYDWIDECKDKKTLSTLAALLAWCDGASPKQLNRDFGVHYALLSKLAEQIAYLVEITKELLPSRLEDIWKRRKEDYLRIGQGDDRYLEELNRKEAFVQDMFVSVYYGVNTEIIQDLQEFLRECGTDAALKALEEDFSLQHIDPITARKMSRLVIRYKFFENPPKVDMNDIEQRNNFRYQRETYVSDIKGMGSHIFAYFAKKFPSEFAQKAEV